MQTKMTSSKREHATSDNLELTDGSKVAVIGPGPAGSFGGYFLLEMAERSGMDLAVDIFEPRDFGLAAPHGCNMGGGIIVCPNNLRLAQGQFQFSLRGTSKVEEFDREWDRNTLSDSPDTEL